MNSIPVELIRLVVGVVAAAAFVGLNGLLMVWIERKVAGHIQRRPGPFEVGPHGLIQPLCDAAKLMGKQLFKPKGADTVLYWAAPLLSFIPVIPLFLPIPFDANLYSWDVNLGLILILALSGINVLSLCLAGWSQNNKYGLLGGARAVSQAVAYEIPLLLALLAVCFMDGTLNLSTMVESQGSWPWQWNVAYQPLAFIIYFVCAVAETNRTPFDLPEGESELTAGFHTEYSGMGFGMFFLAEYVEMIVISAIATVVFLGGWKGPFFDGWWWMLLKLYFLLLAIVWFRWTFPRVRFDQLLNINWKWLLPLALINLMVTAFLVNVF